MLKLHNSKPGQTGINSYGFYTKNRECTPLKLQINFKFQYPSVIPHTESYIYFLFDKLKQNVIILTFPLALVCRQYICN